MWGGGGGGAFETVTDSLKEIDELSCFSKIHSRVKPVHCI